MFGFLACCGFVDLARRPGTDGVIYHSTQRCRCGEKALSMIGAHTRTIRSLGQWNAMSNIRYGLARFGLGLHFRKEVRAVPVTPGYVQHLFSDKNIARRSLT